MKTITKIACRTVGTAGIGLALYDAIRVANRHAKIGSQNETAKHLEKAYFSSRSIENDSYTSNAIRKKTYELRSNNPLPSIWGTIKGGVSGAVNSLGTNLITIACSSCALLAKGTFAKIGAVGTCLALCYDVLRNGFGLGKHNPMN